MVLTRNRIARSNGVESIQNSTVATNTLSNITTTQTTGNGNVTNTRNKNPARYIEWGIKTEAYTYQCSCRYRRHRHIFLQYHEPKSKHHIVFQSICRKIRRHFLRTRFVIRNNRVGMAAVTTDVVINITSKRATLNVIVTDAGG